MIAGSGEITVNGRTLDNYFPNKLHQQDVLLPLTLLDREGQFDIKVSVNGGGPTGQSGALRLAIARALNVYNPADRAALKKAGLLTRDARAVERKKLVCTRHVVLRSTPSVNLRFLPHSRRTLLVEVAAGLFVFGVR